MKESIYQNNYQKLQKLIERVAIVDIPALSLASEVSQWQISSPRVNFKSVDRHSLQTRYYSANFACRTPCYFRPRSRD
jgi:hypothetical protein